MRDFRAAIGPVLAIEGLLMARFADSLRTRTATTAGKDPIGPGAVLLGVAIIWASRLLL